MTKEEKIEY